MKYLRYIYLKYNTFILYAIYGIPPTVIGFLLYLTLTEYTSIPASLANGIAWIIGIIISFFLYHKFVFKMKHDSKKRILNEFIKFCYLRIMSGIFETLFIFVFVDVLHFHRILSKITGSLLAALINYFVSKFFIFTNKKKDKDS